MRRTGIAVLAGFIVLTGAAVPPPLAIEQEVVAALSAGAKEVSTRSEGSDDGAFTWASWTEGAPDRWTTRLVLIRRVGSADAAVVWRTARPGGYDAALEVTPWRFHERPILVLRYQFGAAFTRVELYAAGPDGQVAELGAVEGALVQLERRGGSATLRAWDDALLRMRARCFGWRTAANRLVPVTCIPTG